MNRSSESAGIQISERILKQYNVDKNNNSEFLSCEICPKGHSRVNCLLCNAPTCPAHLLYYETANPVGYSQLQHMALCVKHLGDVNEKLCIMCNKPATGNALHGPIYSVIRSKRGWICSRCCLEDPSPQCPHPNCNLFALLKKLGLPVRYCNIEELSWQDVVLEKNKGTDNYESTTRIITEEFERRRSAQPHKNLVVGLDVPEERWCIFTIARKRQNI